MELTHFNEEGRAHMVDVGGKPVTHRTARAMARVRMAPETMERIRAGTIGKGDVLAVAQVAGITAAKRTSDLIPLCHPLTLGGGEPIASCALGLPLLAALERAGVPERLAA